MNPASSKKKWIVIGALAMLTVAITWYQFGREEPDDTGTAIDVTTGAPLEGVYVLAAYYDAHSSFGGHSSSWCVQTKGMYTGKDGTFRFPPVKGSPVHLSAIKPGYFGSWDRVRRLDQSVDFHRFAFRLKPQDSADPKFSSGEFCYRARTRQDVTANIEFLKIELAERIKYGDTVRAESLRTSIFTLESMR